jgi:hypothetical protein
MPRLPYAWYVVGSGRALVVVLLAGLALACSADPTPPTPTADPPDRTPAGPTPTAQANPPTPTAAPTTPPATPPTPVPTPNAPIEWQRVLFGDAFSPADVIAGVASVGVGVVAVGSYEDEFAAGAAAWLSVDGFTWQPAPTVGQNESAAMEGVTAGPAGLVAVGWRDDEDGTRPAVWVSTDGRDWVHVEDANLDRGQMTAVAGNSLGYVALGFDPDTDEGLAWTSRDGRAWSDAMVVPEFEIQPSINDVVALGEGFIAYGSTARDERAALWTSFDGRSWQRVLGMPTSPSSTVNSVTASGTRLVAVGASYVDAGTIALAWASDDGIDWQAVLDDTAAEAGEMVGVVSVRSGFLAVGSVEGPEREDLHGVLWWSDDGLTWLREPDQPPFVHGRVTDVLRAGPGLVVIGETADDPAMEEFTPTIWLGQAR